MTHSHEGDCPSCSGLGSLIASKAPVEDAPLSQWPIQIKLMGSTIPFLKDADLLVAADCTAFAVKDFHDTYLGDKKVLIGCPKLDDARFYIDKFAEIFSTHDVRSVTCLRMQVPCCGGMSVVLQQALKKSGRNIPLTEIVVGVKGEKLSEQPLEI